MNTDQIASLVRSGMKIIAGLLAAHGLADAAGIVNTPDVISAVLLIVSLAWSHFTHASDTTLPPSLKPTVLAVIAVGTAAILFTGCATANRNVFSAEQAAAATSSAALQSYAIYWNKAEANPAAFHRTLPALADERAKVEATAVQIGSSIDLVENLRAAYVTNSAVAPQLNAAVAALAQNAGYIVILVDSFTSPTNNVTQ